MSKFTQAEAACARLIAALTVRKVSWRGITYLLKGGGKIQLAQYQPYGPAAQTETASSLV